VQWFQNTKIAEVDSGSSALFLSPAGALESMILDVLILFFGELMDQVEVVVVSVME